MMKKGIRGHDVRAEGLGNIVTKMSEFGMEYVQLVLERSIPGFTQGAFTPEYAEEIRRALGDTKIAVLGSYINPSAQNPEIRAGEIAKFKEKIQFAKVLRPLAVGTETGFFGDSLATADNDSEEAYNHVLGTMREIVADAEKNGVNVAIEGVAIFVINSPAKMARIVKDLASDNVKVIFDPVNYINATNYLTQDDIINDTFALLADKLVAIHAKDFTVTDGKISFPDPGLGSLNYKLIFENMKKYNVNPPIIMEGIDEQRAKDSFARLEKIKEGV